MLRIQSLIVLSLICCAVATGCASYGGGTLGNAYAVNKALVDTIAAADAFVQTTDDLAVVRAIDDAVIVAKPYIDTLNLAQRTYLTLQTPTTEAALNAAIENSDKAINALNAGMAGDVAKAIRLTAELEAVSEGSN